MHQLETGFRSFLMNGVEYLSQSGNESIVIYPQLIEGCYFFAYGGRLSGDEAGTTPRSYTVIFKGRLYRITPAIKQQSAHGRHNDPVFYS